MSLSLCVAMESAHCLLRSDKSHFIQTLIFLHRRRKRGGPNNMRGGGANIPFGPPNNPPTFSFDFYVQQGTITNVPS